MLRVYKFKFELEYATRDMFCIASHSPQEALKLAYSAMDRRRGDERRAVLISMSVIGELAAIEED